MAGYARTNYTTYDLKFQFVWLTKDKEKLLVGEKAVKLREILKQACGMKRLRIINGGIGPNYVRLLLSTPPKLAPFEIVAFLKVRSSYLMKEAFPELMDKYEGEFMWADGYFCGSVGEVSQEAIQSYLERRRREEEREAFWIEAE